MISISKHLYKVRELLMPNAGVGRGRSAENTTLSFLFGPLSLLQQWTCHDPLLAQILGSPEDRMCARRISQVSTPANITKHPVEAHKAVLIKYGTSQHGTCTGIESSQGVVYRPPDRLVIINVM